MPGRNHQALLAEGFSGGEGFLFSLPEPGSHLEYALHQAEEAFYALKAR